VRLLKVAKPGFIRWMVIFVLLFSGGKALQKGYSEYQKVHSNKPAVSQQVEHAGSTQTENKAH
jgi:hypothetical protein